MRALNPEIQKTILAALEAKQVPRYQHQFCLCWLSYFLDFCHKNQRDPFQSENGIAYLQHLTDIKRSPFQRDQAWMVIELYQNLFQEPQPVSQITQNEPPQESLPNWKHQIQAMRQEILLRHYSAKTLKAYTHWASRFVKYVLPKTPEQVGSEDLRLFLSHLAIQLKISAGTQNQALNALSFFFIHGLKRKAGQIKMVRAKDKKRIPAVLSPAEIDLICTQLTPPYLLIARLLYGCGLRLLECLSLRVQDLDFERGLIFIHRGKGGKDRSVPLPQALVTELKEQLQIVKEQHTKDNLQGYDGVFIQSQNPSLRSHCKEWSWQWLFPAPQLTSVEGQFKRSHLHATHVQRAIKTAVQKAGISKKASAHTFRHSFASHLLQANVDIKTIQELLGHSHLQTTLIYTHTVKSSTAKNPISPLDLNFQAQTQVVNR